MIGMQNLSIAAWLNPTNPELRAAVTAAVPDLADRKALLDGCRERLRVAQADHRPALGLLPTVVGEAGSVVVRDGLSRKTLGTVDDLCDQVAAQARGEAAVLVWTRACDAVTADIAGRLDAATDRMLGQLNGQLQHVVSAARALPLAGDDQDTWDEFHQLADQHRRLRAGQAQITREFMADEAVQHHATYAYFANYIDLYPAFFEPGSRNSEGVGSITTGVPVPWPADEDGRFLWAGRHPEAVVWIPTTAQLAEAVQAGHVRAQQVRASRQGPDARRRLDTQAREFAEITQHRAAFTVTGVV